MITKVINSFLLGFIFTLLLDFLFFVGIKINYIDAYGIKVYYNALFADNQSYFLLIILSIIFGYLIANKKSIKIFAYIYILLIFFVLATFYKPIGKDIAKLIFEKDNISFKVGDITFKGDLLYKGRIYTYIYRRDINKIIKLSNSDLKD